MKMKVLISVLFLLCFAVMAYAQDDSAAVDTTVIENEVIPPGPPGNLTGYDKPNDHGHAIVLNWELSADDGSGMNNVLLYEIFRWEPTLMSDINPIRDSLDVVKKIISKSTGGIVAGSRIDSILTLYKEEPLSELYKLRSHFEEMIAVGVTKLEEAHKNYPNNGEWVFVDKVPSGTVTFNDVGNKEMHSHNFIPDFTDYYYRVDAVSIDGRSSSEVTGPLQSSGQWFNTYRTPVLFAVIIFTILTVFFVSHARKGADLYVRPLGGIEAIDDAIGRATEMGRPILYVLGLGTAADIATIASFTILGRVAKRVAEYQTELLVPTYDPIVMTVAQEVVKSAYLDAGRPDAYKEDTVHFVTQSQFAYVAAVNGIMLRELPATNVYMGKFFAESLILAETGALAGSIQISGTDEIAQIPFFIVACDYTLIGEELYAASAYLGKEPVLLGSLKAQDYAKAAILVLAIVGMVLAHFEFGHYFTDLFKVLN